MACTQLQRQHNMESGIEEHDMPPRGRRKRVGEMRALPGMDWVCYPHASTLYRNGGKQWVNVVQATDFFMFFYFLVHTRVGALAAYTQLTARMHSPCP